MAMPVRDTLSRCKAQDERQAPNVFLENRELLQLLEVLRHPQYDTLSIPMPLGLWS